MWPSIPSFRPFGDVPCPAGPKCEAIHCLFSHNIVKGKSYPAPSAGTSQHEEQPSAKRLKLDDSTKNPATVSSGSGRTTPTVFVGSLVRKDASTTNKAPSVGGNHVLQATTTAARSDLPRSALRAVSPPPKAAAPQLAPVPDPEVRLTPRNLTKEPAQFTKRLTLLKALRQYMALLNSKTLQSSDASIKRLHLTENQLNKLAVDEEAKVAEQHYSVYENVLKQRLVALKKMAVESWAMEREAVIAKANGVKQEKPSKEKPKPVNTGLKAEEEVVFLKTLITPQAGLEAHGYVTRQPSKAEIDDQWKALAAADYWEKCDRCNTRFQVFPDRREDDGALTTGGKCRHHWGKKSWPKKTKGQMPGSATYTCCEQSVGSEGCFVHDTHVFKISEPKRLSTVMPFIETPENLHADPHMAVCFDCEMGYTTKGLELLRLTAVSWPTHKPILDVLVRPLGHVLDLNTRFSGVTSEYFLNAAEYDPKSPSLDPKNLQIVDSPYIARDLFLSLISPSTPLLGHALENDLNSIRLIHPIFIDTILLYPHPKGLPLRQSLRGLAKTHLGMEIQQAGAEGHDSYEDAWATGELVRHKVMTEWRKMKRDGWTLGEDGACPPVPSGPPPGQQPPPSASEPTTGNKRTLDQYEADDFDESTISTAKRQK